MINAAKWHGCASGGCGLVSDATTSVNLIKEAKDGSAMVSAHIGAVFPLPVNVAGCAFLWRAYQLLSVKY